MNAQDLIPPLVSACLNNIAYPITYTRTLMQLGYEPLPTFKGSKYGIFGPEVLRHPGGIAYMKHIVSIDGLLGLGRGFGSRIACDAVFRVVQDRGTASIMAATLVTPHRKSRLLLMKRLQRSFSSLYNITFFFGQPFFVRDCLKWLAFFHFLFTALFAFLYHHLLITFLHFLLKGLTFFIPFWVVISWLLSNLNSLHLFNQNNYQKSFNVFHLFSKLLRLFNRKVSIWYFFENTKLFNNC